MDASNYFDYISPTVVFDMNTNVSTTWAIKTEVCYRCSWNDTDLSVPSVLDNCEEISKTNTS
jgi:hypothetical protein